jgi:Helix-turn-helix domain
MRNIGNKPNKPTLLNNKKSADFLGIAPGTLEVWRCTGRYWIPYTRVGNRVRYDVADLLAFLESRKVRQ